MPVEACANAKPPHLPHEFRDFANLLAPDSAVERLESVIVRLVRLSSLTAIEACSITKQHVTRSARSGLTFSQRPDQCARQRAIRPSGGRLYSDLTLVQKLDVFFTIYLDGILDLH